MLERFFNNINSETRGPSTEILKIEYEEIMEAMERATLEEKSQPVVVGSDIYLVSDPNHTGREIKPV